MQLKQHKEYQTIRLFAILGLMTALVVLLFKVVLFAPQTHEANRQPAQNSVQGPGISKPSETTK
jgi:hypothetical protein